MDNASVNGEMVPLVMSGVPMTITAGKSSNNPFIISYSALSISTLSEIKNISFNIVVKNNDTLKEIETTGMVSVDF